MNKKIFALILSLIAVLITYFFDGSKLQFFYGALSISVFFVVLSIIIKKQIAQYLCILMFSFGFCLAGIELYYNVVSSNPSPPESWREYSGSISKGFYGWTENLGYVTSPNSIVTETRTKYFADKSDPIIIYDTVYTTNELRHRITPHSPDAKIAIVFIGCSFTFGHGIQDEETFSYIVGQELGDNYQVFNISANGYGSHHVLAMLEGDISFLDKYDYIYVIYSAIRDHRFRSAAIYSWGTLAPRYLMKGDQVVRDGNFEKEFPQYLKGTLLGDILNRSLAYKSNIGTLKKFLLSYGTDEKMWDLFEAIAATSESTLKKKYPNSEFITLSWPGNEDDIINHLPKGMKSFNADAWFPDYYVNTKAYQILYDGHPNVLTNQIVAKGILGLIRSYEKDRESNK